MVYTTVWGRGRGGGWNVTVWNSLWDVNILILKIGRPNFQKLRDTCGGERSLFANKTEENRDAQIPETGAPKLARSANWVTWWNDVYWSSEKTATAIQYETATLIVQIILFILPIY